MYNKESCQVLILGSFFYQSFISPYYENIRHCVGQLLARFENNFSGMAVIKSFTAEPFETMRVESASNDYKSANIAAIRYSTVYVPIIRMAIAFGFAGVLLLGSYWILTGSNQITVGELVLFSMMIQRLLWPLTRLGVMFDDYERANASAKRVLNLLNENIIKIFSKVNKHLIENNLQLIFIPSNRTPKEIITFAKEYFNKNRLIIETVDKKAYLSSLALSKYIVVTCDSSSMISEAALTGKPVYVAMIPSKRNDKRFRRFRNLFEKLNIIKELGDELTLWSYKNLNETNRIALEIKDKLK